jgi:DNA polymerase III subunit delta
MVIFLYGEDEFWSGRKLAEIKQKFTEKNKEGAALSVFDFADKDFDLGSVALEAISGGLFSNKKLIIIKNLLSAKKSPGNESFESFLKRKNKGDYKDVILVFWEGKKFGKDSKIYKFLQKSSKKQEFSYLSGMRLTSWIGQEVKERSKNMLSIGKEAAEKLAVFTGENSFLLSSEIDKLIAYKAKGEIENSDVELLVKAKIDTDVFKTVDALARRDRKEALRLLHGHLNSGDDPFYILSMFFYQFRNLVKIKPLADKNWSSQDIAGKLKMHPYVVRKSLDQARNFSWESLKSLYQRLCGIDFETKTGKIDIRLALDQFIAAV